jgi:hypothetical protein
MIKNCRKCKTKIKNSFTKILTIILSVKTILTLRVKLPCRKCKIFVLSFIVSEKIENKGNAKRGVYPRLKIRPCDLDLWPWKSIGFQTLLRTMYVPSLVKIHWRMLILECSQGCYAVKIWPGDIDLWPWKSIGFQTLLRSKYVPSLVKIHWRILILECSQGCYVINIWPCDLDLWPENQ